MESGQIPALGGIRAVAVFLVIVFHASFPAVPGPHGVLMFFVLSGFLITWLLLKEQEQRGAISLSAFYKRRLLRIFPAFYVFWVLYVIHAVATNKQPPWGAYIASFFYVSDYYRSVVSAVNDNMGHTWSLAIEEQFYLLCPLLVVYLCRDLKFLAKVLAVLVGFLWIARAVRYTLLGLSSEYIYHAFDTRVDHLLIGCLCAVVLKAGLFSGFWKRVCVWQAPLLLLPVIVASAILTHRVEAYRNTIGYAVDPLLFALFMCQMIALHDKPVWSALNWTWVTFLGTISYSLYLYHPLTFQIVHEVLPNLAYRYKAPIGYGVTILVAYLSYRFIETPFLRLKKRATRIQPADDAVRTGELTEFQHARS